MKEFYVYVHRRNDTNEVFYVGNGALKSAGFNASNVKRVADGVYKQYKGFHWRIEKIK